MGFFDINMKKYLKRTFSNLVYDVRFSEIFIGSTWALAARVVATVLGFTFTAIVARFYGVEVVGMIAVINSFIVLASIFTVFGTPTSILRLIPEHLTKYSPTSALKVYRKTQYMVIIISLIASVLLYLNANLIAYKLFSKYHLSSYFALASTFIVFYSMTQLNTQAVRGLKLIQLFALMLLLPKSFNLFFLFIVGFIFPSPDTPIYAILGSMAMTGVLGWIFTEYGFRKLKGHRDKVYRTSRRNILAISLPMLMATTMGFVIGQTGVVFLGIFRTETEVGYYSIAVRLASLTVFILDAVNSMTGPKFSEFYHSGKIDELFYVAKKSAKLIFYTTTPILIGLLASGKFLINTIFGPNFVVAYNALAFLVIGQFVHSISGSTGMFLNMTGNQKVYKNIMIITGMLNISLNLILIPKYGIYGAAITAMVSRSFWNIAILVYTKIKYKKTTGYFPFLNLTWPNGTVK